MEYESSTENSADSGDAAYRESFRGTDVYYPVGLGDVLPKVTERRYPSIVIQPTNKVKRMTFTIEGLENKHMFDPFSEKVAIQGLFKKYFGDDDQKLADTQNKILAIYRERKWEYFPIHHTAASLIFNDDETPLPYLSKRDPLYDELSADQKFIATGGRLEGRDLELLVVNESANGMTNEDISFKFGIDVKVVDKIIKYFMKKHRLPSDAPNWKTGPTKTEILTWVNSVYGDNKSKNVWKDLMGCVVNKYPHLSKYSSKTIAKHIREDYGLKKVVALPRLKQYDAVDTKKLYIAIQTWLLLRIHFQPDGGPRVVYYCSYKYYSKSNTFVYGSEDITIRPSAHITIPFNVYYHCLYDPKLGCYAISFHNKEIDDIQRHNFLSETIPKYIATVKTNRVILVVENSKFYKDSLVSNLFAKLGIAVVLDISRKVSLMPVYDFFMKLVRVVHNIPYLNFDIYVQTIQSWLSENVGKYTWIYRKLCDRLITAVTEYHTLRRGGSSGAKIIGFGPRYGKAREKYLIDQKALYLDLPDQQPGIIPSQNDDSYLDEIKFN